MGDEGREGPTPPSARGKQQAKSKLSWVQVSCPGQLSAPLPAVPYHLCVVAAVAAVTQQSACLACKKL